MDARSARVAAVAAAVLVSLGASYRTPNFVVNAPSPEFARQVGDAAESYRDELAMLWLGRKLPRWSQPCPIRVQVGGGAGGATSFVFHQGEVFGWQMQIQGPPNRLLDSVLPHEVTHTVFATHFRQPLPRWADEGACTTVEHASERSKHQKMLVRFLQTGHGIAFSKMFAMKEYPADILPLYSQGHSLASFLIEQGGRRKYVQFVRDGLDAQTWSSAVEKHYGFANLGHLQTTWLEWVRQGSPLPIPVALVPRTSDDATLLASAAGREQDRVDPTEPSASASATTTNDVARPSVYMRRGSDERLASSPNVEGGAEARRRPTAPLVSIRDDVQELAGAPRSRETVETASDLSLPATPRPPEEFNARRTQAVWRSSAGRPESSPTTLPTTDPPQSLGALLPPNCPGGCSSRRVEVPSETGAAGSRGRPEYLDASLPGVTILR